MFKFLLGFAVGWFFTEILRNWYDNTTSEKVANLIDKILYTPLQLLTWAFYIVLFPIIWIYQMFKNVVHPATPEQWQRAKIEKYWGKKNFKIVFDWDAKRIINKVFFVRVKGINNLSVVTSNIPSSPDDEFRIGPEWDEYSNRIKGEQNG